jgi:hypothetical protein
MEFKVEKRANPNQNEYANDDIDIAYDFSKKAIKEFGVFIKSIAIFGSTVRVETKQHNDIDMLVIVDDLSVVMSPELVETYRVIMERIIANSSKKLHVTTLRMTNFWDYVRKGDPIGLNILRDGVALYDTNLFEPLRILLREGKISPSQETINVYMNKASASLFSSRNHILQATLDLYWAVIDISHAALMQEGVMPTSPSHVSVKLAETFCNKKHGLEKHYPQMMEKFYKLSRAIIHNELTHVSGADFEIYLKDAKIYTDRMKRFIKIK